MPADIETVFDAMKDSMRNTRSDYHLTLGDLIDALEGVEDATLPVVFDDAIVPGSLKSYRGYYDDLAFELREVGSDVTVSDVLDECRDALDTKFTGYKGGEFYMGEDTPLWRAAWGEIGKPVLAVEERDEQVVLTLGERN